VQAHVDRLAGLLDLVALHVGDVDQQSVVREHGGDPAGDAAADCSLLIPVRELAPLGVAEEEPHADAGPGLGAQRRQPIRVLLRQEQTGEGERVHRPLGLAEQIGPQALGHVGAPRIGRHDLDPGQRWPLSSSTYHGQLNRWWPPATSTTSTAAGCT